MLFYKTYSVWLKREFRRWFKHAANVIYRRRWFRNARPVTFIVLPRAYVRTYRLFSLLFRNWKRIRGRGEGAGGRKGGNEIGDHRNPGRNLSLRRRSGLTWLSRQERSGFTRKGKRSACVRRRDGQRKHERSLWEKGVDAKRVAYGKHVMQYSLVTSTIWPARFAE